MIRDFITKLECCAGHEALHDFKLGDNYVTLNWRKSITVYGENMVMFIDITEDEYCTYEIFSAYRIEVEDYYITTGFKSNDEFDTFINRLKKRSFRNFGVEVSGEDQILTLSTCSNADYRVAVHAKKIVEQNEE